MEGSKLSSLALSFASFLVDRINVKSIILFGSAASGNFDSKSDIDLFIETEKKNEGKIKQMLEMYKKTKEHEKFFLSGIQNEISIKCGSLDEWKDLKRSIISNGIVLYGKYQGKPSELKHKLLFVLATKKISRAEKKKIWRKIYGYSQKIGKKVYTFKGMAGKKLGMGAFIAALEDSKEIIEYLNKHRANYTYFDIWVE
ncbi:MAG: nucleotidyltransferase domain-containing protein [Nanoarchaeota archaeon]|nr:nucleotidyltransferase domain-containing protein [Nanoarchaeota archaeon]